MALHGVAGSEATQGWREGIKDSLPSEVQSHAIPFLHTCLNFGVTSATKDPGSSEKESQAWAEQAVGCLSKLLSSWQQVPPNKLMRYSLIPA